MEVDHEADQYFETNSKDVAMSIKFNQLENSEVDKMNGNMKMDSVIWT